MPRSKAKAVTEGASTKPQVKEPKRTRRPFLSAETRAQLEAIREHRKAELAERLAKAGVRPAHVSWTLFDKDVTDSALIADLVDFHFHAYVGSVSPRAPTTVPVASTAEPGSALCVVCKGWSRGETSMAATAKRDAHQAAAHSAPKAEPGKPSIASYIAL